MRIRFPRMQPMVNVGNVMSPWLFIAFSPNQVDSDKKKTINAFQLLSDSTRDFDLTSIA